MTGLHSPYWTVTRLRDKIQALETADLNGLSTGAISPKITILAEEIWAESLRQEESGIMDEGNREKLQRLTMRIRLISSSLAGLEADCLKIQQDARQQTTKTLGDNAARERPSERDPYLPLRHWFLAHFSNPYPSIPEKEELMRQYPKHSKQQIDTWFTNIRRRSGWQELKKKYTNGTQEDFEKLIKATEREERTFMVEKCRVMIQEIKGFLRDGGRERVSDSIQEIVKKGAPATCTKRKIQARQSRGEGGGYRQTSSSSSSQELPPLPFPFPSYPSMQMVDSPSSLYPTALPSVPRHPSTFSSPTSSLRSVSDSSSSSFDSVLSYNSTSTTASYHTASLPTIQTPSSPPAMSSLLSFNTPTRPLSSQESSQLQSRPLPPPIENPYFFTLNNTPLLPLLSEPEPALASSSLAGFASNGDLIV